MNLSSVGYILRETFSSIIRNPLLSLASVITIMVSLVILGGSIFFFVNAENIARSFESQLEIHVFVQDEAGDEDVARLEEQIRSLAGVASVTLITKEEALHNFGKEMGSRDILADLGGINPFPDSFVVQVVDPQQIGDIAKTLATFAGVDKVRYGQGVVENLTAFTKWLRWVGAGIVVVFAVASLVLIALNIRMNVFSRRREIQIMKMVGASNSFIRWPFFIQGLILGLVGAILSSVIVALAYRWFVDYLRTTLAFIPIADDPILSFQVTGILIIGGMAIGAMGSAFSLRKFLHV